MIRALRNSGIGQIFLGAIVVAIILAFVLTGASPGAGDAADECVAEVGKHCISSKEYDAAYRLFSAIGGGSINEAAAKRLRLQEQVARGLAERELLAEEAERIGLSTSEDDVDEHLLEGRARVSLPAADAEGLALSLAMCVDGPMGCEPGTIGLRAIDVTRDGRFDIEVYKRTVRVWTRRSPAQFKEMQMREHTAERLRQLVRSQVRVSEEEAFLAYARTQNKATARLLNLNKAWFERFAIEVTEAELAKTLEEQPDAVEELKARLDADYEDDCLVVRELRIDSADPGTEEAEAAAKTAKELALKARVTRDLESLARLHSDADSARLGGYVGCLSEDYGAGVTALLEAAKELKRPGAVSNVVETISGFVVLQLVGAATDETREELLSRHATLEITSSRLAQEKMEGFAQAVLERAADGSSLQEANQAALDGLLGYSPVEDVPATSADGVPRVEISRAVTVDQPLVDDAAPGQMPTLALFDLEEDDLLQEPVKTNSGLVVVQLKSKELLTKDSFEEDRVRIQNTLRKRKAEQTLSQFVEKLERKAGGITLNPKFIQPQSTQNEEQDS